MFCEMNSSKVFNTLYIQVVIIFGKLCKYTILSLVLVPYGTFSTYIIFMYIHVHTPVISIKQF
jgi:hypothetical protein